MKNPKVGTKPSNLFVQGITALPLALSLQFSAGCSIKQQNGTHSYSQFHNEDSEGSEKKYEDNPTLNKDIKDIGKGRNLKEIVLRYLSMLNGPNSEYSKQILNQDYIYHNNKFTIFGIVLEKVARHEALGPLGNNKYFELVKEMLEYPNYIDFNRAKDTFKEDITSVNYILDFIKKDPGRTKNMQEILLELLDKYPAIDVTSKDEKGRPPIKVLFNFIGSLFSNADPNVFSSIISKILHKYKRDDFLSKDSKERNMFHYILCSDIPFRIVITDEIEDKIEDNLNLFIGHNLNLFKNLIKLMQSSGCGNQEIFDMLVNKDKKERIPLLKILDRFKLFLKGSEDGSQRIKDSLKGLVDLLDLDLDQLKRIRSTIPFNAESKKKYFGMKYEKCANIVEEMIQEKEKQSDRSTNP